MQQSLISTTSILLLVLALAFYPITPSAQLSPIQPPISSTPTPPFPSPAATSPSALTKKTLPKDLKVSLKPGEGGEGGGGGGGGGGVLISAAGTVRLFMWVNVVVVVGVALFGGAIV